MILVGLAAGFLGGMFGVGGGILFVPAFLFLLKDRIPSVHVAVGTSMAIIVANSIAGTIAHAINGRVNWQVAVWVAVFAVIGGFLGANVSGLVGKTTLQRLFAILLILVAAKMFFTKPAEAKGPTGVQTEVREEK
jgi:uncharacterized membrane protein YfcA